jgi:glycosyltransferase involved in cell wall biosynthesis
MTARVVPWKGQGFLLDALELRRDPRLKAFILGDASNEFGESLRARATARPLAGSVQFLGYRDDVDTLLAAMDVFALPSGTEGLSMAILEAMSAGLPVVAASVGGVSEVVVPGETGFLCPYGDAPALADALASLAAAPELRAAMGARGRARHRERFGIPQMIERTVETYRAAAAR